MLVAGEEAEGPDPVLGERAALQLPGQWTEVHAVCGGAVGAAPRPEGEGETGAGKKACAPPHMTAEQGCKYDSEASGRTSC